MIEFVTGPSSTPVKVYFENKITARVSIVSLRWPYKMSRLRKSSHLASSPYFFLIRSGTDRNGPGLLRSGAELPSKLIWNLRLPWGQEGSMKGSHNQESDAKGALVLDFCKSPW